MPKLLPKREAFAHAIIKSPKTGMSQAACYIAAGYAARNHAAEVNASRLLKNAEVKMIIQELGQPVVRQTRVSLLNVLAELETTLRDARQDRAHGAVVAALGLVTKIHELVRTEGATGEFDRCTDIPGLAVQMIDEGDLETHLELLDTMRDALIEAASNRAEPVAKAYRPRDEVLPAMKTLRPTRR